MPVSPSLLSDLLHVLHDENALKSYQAASSLEKLKPEMTDEQRAHYEASLADVSHHRQEVAKAKEEAEAELRDEWDKDEKWQ